MCNGVINVSTTFKRDQLLKPRSPQGNFKGFPDKWDSVGVSTDTSIVVTPSKRLRKTCVNIELYK